MKLQLLCKFESSFIDSLKYRDVNSLKGRDVAKVDGGRLTKGTTVTKTLRVKRLNSGRNLWGGGYGYFMVMQVS